MSLEAASGSDARAFRCGVYSLSNIDPVNMRGNLLCGLTPKLGDLMFCDRLSDAEVDALLTQLASSELASSEQTAGAG
jgi:hypothetical protein